MFAAKYLHYRMDNIYKEIKQLNFDFYHTLNAVYSKNSGIKGTEWLNRNILYSYERCRREIYWTNKFLQQKYYNQEHNGDNI